MTDGRERESSPSSLAHPLPGTNAVLFGRKGSGKTTLSRLILQHHSRVLIIDPLREYGEVSVQVGSPEELAAYLQQTEGRWRVSYTNDHLAADFDALCRFAYSVGDCLLVVEEADLFCQPTFIPDDFYTLIVYGRHQRAHVMTVSRVPSDVHRTITRQAWEVYCFTIQEPNDLDYIRRYVGRDFADGLQALPPLHYRYQDLWDRTRPMQELTLTRAKGYPESSAAAPPGSPPGQPHTVGATQSREGE